MGCHHTDIGLYLFNHYYDVTSEMIDYFTQEDQRWKAHYLLDER